MGKQHQERRRNGARAKLARELSAGADLHTGKARQLAALGTKEVNAGTVERRAVSAPREAVDQQGLRRRPRKEVRTAGRSVLFQMTETTMNHVQRGIKNGT